MDRRPQVRGATPQLGPTEPQAAATYAQETEAHRIHRVSFCVEYVPLDAAALKRELAVDRWQGRRKGETGALGHAYDRLVPVPHASERGPQPIDVAGLEFDHFDTSHGIPRH
ncbi:hypothetical protein [Streptodolium elevatio]|uniref:Uncharacterized protein n=1 Tax=Streptodolium elevatio TaxID=3157996 RepID=A0ABV3DEP3_9ACTN